MKDQEYFINCKFHEPINNGPGCSNHSYCNELVQKAYCDNGHIYFDDWIDYLKFKVKYEK